MWTLTLQDRFIDGQAECALRRHLDSLGPDTPMADIVEYSLVWESHIELASDRRMGTDRQFPHAVCQVTVDGQSSVESPETESLEDSIRKLLPTPARPPPKAVPIPLDKDLLIQRLIGAIRPSQLVAQERSKLTYLEIMLQNWLPVGTLTEEEAASPNSRSGSPEG